MTFKLKFCVSWPYLACQWKSNHRSRSKVNVQRVWAWQRSNAVWPRSAIENSFCSYPIHRRLRIQLFCVTLQQLYCWK